MRLMHLLMNRRRRERPHVCAVSRSELTAPFFFDSVVYGSSGGFDNPGGSASGGVGRSLACITVDIECA